MIKPLTLLDLPDCLLENVMSYLSYDEIAKTRIVCRKFNEINQQILNKGFYKLQNYNQSCIRRLRAQLLRYESQRLNHTLSMHLNAQMYIRTNLWSLSTTYEMYMRGGSVCFIPGRIIDECYRLIRLVCSDDETAQRSVYDINIIISMAIDHFIHYILPQIKIGHNTSLFDSLNPYIISQPTSNSAHSTPQRASISAQITPQQQPSREPGRVIKKCKKSKLSTLLTMYKKQTRQIGRMMKLMREQRTTLNSLKRRLDESEAKNTSEDSTAN